MADAKISLTEDEWQLYRVVNTAPIFSEFVRYYTKDDSGKQFRLWDKQIREMNREEIHLKRFQGRYLGKSITCIDQVNRLVVLYSGDDGTALMGTRSDLNLQPIWEKTISLFERNHFLSMFLIEGVRAIDRKNREIRLRNNVIIKGRIQGKDGQGFNTVHPNIIAWIDEAQFISDAAISEFYGMVSAELPIMASGVPNGVQTSWAFHIDNDYDSDFAGGGMTRLDDPRMTPEFHEQLKRAYGGETSNLYRQKVLGEWGADARMTFDIERMEHDLPLIPGTRPKAPPWYRTVVIDSRSYDIDTLASSFALRKELPDLSHIWIAADHGGSGSPTTGYVHYFDTKENCWRQYIRFLLYGMQAHPQVESIHFLATELERMYGKPVIIGIDTTGQGGQAIASILEEIGHTIIWSNVSEKVKFGERLESEEEVRERFKHDPFADPRKQLVPIEMPLRQVAIPQALIPNLYSGNIRVVEEPDLWAQFGGTVDYEDALGKYRKYETDFSKDGNPNYNHDLSAFEVFGAMIHRQEFNPGAPTAPDIWTEEMDIGWSGSTDAY